jgi:hypothetical protein
MSIISSSNSGTDFRGQAMQSENENEVPDLSLMEGGPGDSLMKRLRLIRPELGAASARTAIILAAITWIPLLAFSLVEGLVACNSDIGIALMYREVCVTESFA